MRTSRTKSRTVPTAAADTRDQARPVEIVRSIDRIRPCSSSCASVASPRPSGVGPRPFVLAPRPFTTRPCPFVVNLSNDARTVGFLARPSTSSGRVETRTAPPTPSRRCAPCSRNRTRRLACGEPLAPRALGRTQSASSSSRYALVVNRTCPEPVDGIQPASTDSAVRSAADRDANHRAAAHQRLLRRFPFALSLAKHTPALQRDADQRW
jgi:hypothetical protein